MSRQGDANAVKLRSAPPADQRGLTGAQHTIPTDWDQRTICKLEDRLASAMTYCGCGVTRSWICD